MSGFKDMVAEDVKTVFLNADEFAEVRTIKYDGETYDDVPVVLVKIKAEDRVQYRTARDHAEGLYMVSQVLYVAEEDLDGVVPEKGMPIEISDTESSTYFEESLIAQVGRDMGMLRIELEAYDE